MKPSELNEYRTASQPAAHPVDQRIAFVVSRVDVDADRNERQVWMWDGEAARPHTSGPGDQKPVWSPDGAHLAFLRVVDGKPQLAVMRADGGEATVLTAFSHGVWGFEWSPNSRLIACTARQWREELSDEERLRRPRRITEIPYRFDFEGWRSDWHEAVWVVDASGAGEPRRLTGDDRKETSPTWHPSGESIAYLGDRSTGPVRRGNLHVCVARLDDGTEAVLTDETAFQGLTYRSDGVLHAWGDPDPAAWPALISFWKLDGAPTDLTGHLDRSVYGLASPVHLGRVAVHAAGVGQVGCRDIEAHGLRVHCTTCNIEYVRQAH